MLSDEFSDGGSKYHKISKFLANTDKICRPYRPPMN